MSNKNNDNKYLFEGFYEEVNNPLLKEVFTLFHLHFNRLFEYMNYKNYDEQGGHFNADESRELIGLLEEIKLIQVKLKDEFYFEIDEDYSNIMSQCKLFLTRFGGSPIPVGFPKIELAEDRPIFILSNTISITTGKMNFSANLVMKGEGSYAKVYSYVDSFYGIKFAIKRANNDLRVDELERFRSEYADLKALDSPFIVKAYSYDDQKNEYVMEYVDFTLEKYIDKHNDRLTLKDRRMLIEQLLLAFQYLHSKGLLHRDIGFTNILVKVHEDGSKMLKVSDFGLVKREGSNLTKQGTEIKGAINDYSDLTIVGFENYEIRHETYALVKVIYYILTGKKGNYHKEKNPILENFLSSGLSSDKNNRYRSVIEIRKALTKMVYPSFAEVYSN